MLKITRAIMHHKHQRWLNMENAQLQAALSFWVSKRDEAKSNLDIFLNKPNGNFENPQHQINYLLKDFSDAQSVITTITLIIQNASGTNTSPTEQQS